MKILNLVFSFLIVTSFVFGQKEKDKDKKSKEWLTSSTVSGLKFRSIGPAFTSGRISDFAVNPNNHSEYYVASSSGNLWKTTNSGTTWDAIADTLPYSLGIVVLDPTNPNVVWVGTGENNHQRALGYGTGVYKSLDGGKTWKFVGLKDSRQIGGIVIDSKNSNIVYVAAEGSAWGLGGERGLYKTIDGGKTWNKVLNVSENTGINNVVMDTRDSNVLYATSEQRRRHIFTKINGGPESAVFKTTDAGATWEKVMNGLPKVDIGGMGIAISSVNPDVVYLIMQAAENSGGFFRSTNRGASWEKMSDHSESGQYYNEIYCDPKDVNKVYSVETVTQFTEDAGKTWKVLGNDNRHVDDHALWIDPFDTNHILIGGDGGVYESYDCGKTFLFKCNLPVTQFYRVSVDDDKPFYNIYGGTQDNNSFYGPSRTLSADGIVNSDWTVTTGGDGFFQATEPGNPNIVYSAWQYGNIIRYDKLNGETVDIRPEPGKGEKTYKWYWDTPFIVSPHSPTRIYIAAERVFKSDDRGNSWQTISDDLSTKTDRNSFPVMGKYWSYDAVGKDMSTSLFGLVVSLAESKKKENLLYAGTDDGLIQVTEDLKTWRKIEDFPGVPKFTLVSDILPSQFDENVLYASFNNHQRDDFKPYLLKSTDKGKTWKSIASNLPMDGAVNTIVEDPEKPNLLFVGTEWGVYFSVDGGEKWVQLKAGIPKVKVTDITIQEREKDLVVATFGRGFFIIDDYSPLRLITKDLIEKESEVFPIKDALMYVQKSGRYGQGTTYFKAPNPEFGATITYYIKDSPKTLKAIRKEKEKELFKDGKPIPQPSIEDLRLEEKEKSPYLVFTITDENGNVIKKINKAASSGINRVVWDLRMENVMPITTDKFDPLASGGRRGGSGYFVLPGKYFVTMAIVVRGEEKVLKSQEPFHVVMLKSASLPADDFTQVIKFQNKAAELSRTALGAQKLADELQKKLESIKQVLNSTPKANYDLLKRANSISEEIDAIVYQFNGPTPKASSEEIPPVPVSLNSRISNMTSITSRSTSNITKNQIVAYDVLLEELQPIIDKLKNIKEVEVKTLEDELEKINAPWTPGRIPRLNK